MAKRLHADPSRALAKFRRDVAGQPAPTSSEWEVGNIEAKHEQRWKNLKDFTTLATKAEQVTRNPETGEGGITSKAWEGIKGIPGKFTDDKGVFQGGEQGRLLGRYRDEGEKRHLRRKNEPPSSDPESMDMNQEANAEAYSDKPKQPNVNEKLQKVKAMGGTALKALAYGAAMTNPVTGTLATAYGLNQLQQKKHDEEYDAPEQKEASVEADELKKYRKEKGQTPGDEAKYAYKDRFKQSDLYRDDIGRARKDPLFMEMMEGRLGKAGFKRYNRRYDRNQGKATTTLGKLAEKGKGYAEKIGEAKKSLEAAGMKHSKNIRDKVVQKQRQIHIDKMTPEVAKLGKDTIHELNKTHMANTPEVAVNWDDLMKQNEALAGELTPIMYNLGITDPSEQKEFLRLNYVINLNSGKEDEGTYPDDRPQWNLSLEGRYKDSQGSPSSSGQTRYITNEDDEQQRKEYITNRLKQHSEHE